MKTKIYYAVVALLTIPLFSNADIFGVDVGVLAQQLIQLQAILRDAETVYQFEQNMASMIKNGNWPGMVQTGAQMAQTGIALAAIRNPNDPTSPNSANQHLKNWNAILQAAQMVQQDASSFGSMSATNAALLTLVQMQAEIGASASSDIQRQMYFQQTLSTYESPAAYTLGGEMSRLLVQLITQHKYALAIIVLLASIAGVLTRYELREKAAEQKQLQFQQNVDRIAAAEGYGLGPVSKSATKKHHSN